MKKLLIIVLLLASVVAQAQIRQRSATKGFNAAVQFHVLGWTSNYFKYLDENATTGFGGGIRAGYGITELIEPYLGFDITGMSKKDVDARSFTMLHFDGGLRVNLAGTVHPLRPFLEAGYSYLRGSVKQVINGSSHVDLVFSGGKPHAGGGIAYFPKVPISIFAHGLFTIGKKSSATLDGSEITDKPDVTTFRISLGVNVNISELIKQ